MKNKAITYIVLVITIILLLILAKIVISQLTDKNVIISKARKEKEQQINSEVENNGSVQFWYDICEKKSKIISILIHIQDSENGLEKIGLPEKDAIISNGTKKEVAIDYEVEIGKEYKIIITSGNGNKKEEIIYIEPQFEITEAIIGTTPTSITSVADNSQISGTTLYINFSATLEGQECTIINKEDGKNVPYEITRNETYSFIVSGIYEGKEITKETIIKVNKYIGLSGFVQYDAGEWTKEEIEELKILKLYDLNENRLSSYVPKLKDDKAFGLTFGGFTYKGDIENENKERVITSRNVSGKTIEVWNTGIDEPRTNGWQILDIYFCFSKSRISSRIFINRNYYE